VNSQFVAVVFNLTSSQLIDHIPGHIQRVLIRKSVKHAIAAKNNEIMEVWSHREL
jgi:hypothetical protein